MDTCGQGCCTRAGPRSRSIVPLPVPDGSRRAQVRLALGDRFGRSHPALEPVRAGAPPNPGTALLGVLGCGKRGSVPSVLLLLTPPADMGDLGMLRSRGHIRRCPSSQHGCCGAHPIPAPVPSAVSVLGAVPVLRAAPGASWWFRPGWKGAVWGLADPRRGPTRTMLRQ